MPSQVVACRRNPQVTAAVGVARADGRSISAAKSARKMIALVSEACSTFF
jgi:hypothetical protein